MYTAEINWRLNTYGADTLKLIYAGINKHNPQLELTPDNSKILKLMPYGDPSDDLLTYMLIQKGDDPSNQYEFKYQRQRVTELATRPFTNAEITEMKAITNSAALLDYIARKWNYALTPDDVWVSINSVDYTGGQVKPNWLLETRYNSICWMDKMVVWLHQAP